MRLAVRVAIVLVFWVLLATGVQALWSWLTGTKWSLWESLVLGICFGAVEQLVRYSERRGWLTFELRSGADRIKKRQQELAQEREQILADALAAREATDQGDRPSDGG